MTIIKHNQFKYIADEKHLSFLEENNDKQFFLDNLIDLLNYEYYYLFNKKKSLCINTLYKKEQVDHELNIVYILCTDLITSLLDITSGIVYTYSTIEYDSYLDQIHSSSNMSNEPLPFALAEKNLISSTKIPLNNFIELINNWHQLNLQKVPFALLYQDEQNWIACKGFDTQEAMEAFVKQHSDEQS